MVRAKKKKGSGPAPDFQKAKHKVGGRNVAAANETRTEFRSRRINVPSQLQRRPDAGANVAADLLSKTQHHNARERRQALDQLRGALQRFHGNVACTAAVTTIVRVVARLALDDDGGVRRALHALLRCADFALVAPFASDQLNRFVLAAMTHPSMAVRVDGVLALDVILAVASGSTAGVRDQFLSAVAAALHERTETDALGLAKGTVGAALRCCVALLTSEPQTLNPSPNPNLALLHTPDPFRPSPNAPLPFPPDLLEQVAGALVECAVECADAHPASLSLCVRGLYSSCLGPHLSAATVDRVHVHIVPLFAAPFADADLKLQICRLAVALWGPLPGPMVAFLSSSFSSDDVVLPCEILLAHDDLPPALIDAFVGALDQVAPSSPALGVCLKFFSQFAGGVRERVLRVVARRFVPCPALRADAVTLLLDGVRLYQTAFDPLSLLQHDLVGGVVPADQARIAALFGYVDFGLEALPAFAAALCDGDVAVAARSLLLDLVLARRLLPAEAVLSLLVTVAVRDERLLPAATAALSRLHVRRPGACSAALDAVARLLPTRSDRDEIHRLETFAAAATSLIGA